MNADGTGDRNLSNFPGSDAWAAWSPDGTKIAFATDRDGNFEIYVMNADGSSPTRLTNNPGMDYQPSWSPDGDKILFTRIDEDAPFGANAEIYVLSLEIQGEKLPDGSFSAQVVVSDIKNLTNAAGMPNPNPNLPPIVFNDLEPVWSPNGSKIAFTSDRDGNFEIYVMNTDGSGQVNLTNSPFADADSDWSPAGDQLLFTSNRSGNGDIWLMQADGSVARQLTFDPGTDLGPAWSPDGTQIVFTGVPAPGMDDIFAMNADGSNRTRLTSNPTGDFLPDWQGFDGDLTLPLPPSFPAGFVAPTRFPVIGMFSSGGLEHGAGSCWRRNGTIGRVGVPCVSARPGQPPGATGQRSADYCQLFDERSGPRTGCALCDSHADRGLRAAKRTVDFPARRDGEDHYGAADR